MSIIVPFDIVCHGTCQGVWCDDGGEDGDECHVEDFHRTTDVGSTDVVELILVAKRITMVVVILCCCGRQLCIEYEETFLWGKCRCSA